MCNGRWRWLNAGLEYLRRLVNAHDRRKWSGAIGQHNLLQFCTSSPRQQSKKKHTGPTVVIPPDVMELVFDELERVILRTEDMEKIKSRVPRSGDDAEPSGETMQPGSKTRPSKQGTSATNSIGLIKAEKGLHAVAELNLNVEDRKYLE